MNSDFFRHWSLVIRICAEAPSLRLPHIDFLRTNESTPAPQISRRLGRLLHRSQRDGGRRALRRSPGRARCVARDGRSAGFELPLAPLSHRDGSTEISQRPGHQQREGFESWRRLLRRAGQRQRQDAERPEHLRPRKRNPARLRAGLQRGGGAAARKIHHRR